MFVCVIEYVCTWDTVDTPPHNRIFQGLSYDEVTKKINEFVTDKSRGILHYEIVSIYDGNE